MDEGCRSDYGDNQFALFCTFFGGVTIVLVGFLDEPGGQLKPVVAQAECL